MPLIAAFAAMPMLIFHDLLLCVFAVAIDAAILRAMMLRYMPRCR